VTPPGQTKAPGEEAQGAGIGPSQEAARTAAGQPPTIDNAAEVFLALLKKLIKIQDVIMKGFNEKIRRDLLFPKEVSKGYKFPDDSPAWFYSRENRKETEILRREIEDFIEDNRQLMQVIREAMQLDFKEMESLKYLAKKLEGEERSLTKSYGYYRNLNYQNYNRNITNQYDKNKSYVPLSIPSHLRDFEIRPELKGGIRLQLIRIDQELEAYFVKNLAPVLLRLYQLFKEFEEVLIKEQKVLDNLKIISNRLPAEGEMGEVDQELKDNLGNYIRAFVDIVKKKEWILYKNLEKDHDDKAQAEKELEAEILKRRGVEERGKKGGSWGGLGGTAPDFSNIRLVIKEPKTGSSHYIGDPIKRLDVEVIDLRTNQVIQGFSEGEGYEYGWVITGQNGERHRIFRKKSTLKSGETTLPVSDRLEAGEATLTVYLSKGEFNTKSEDMIIFLKDKGGRGTDSRRKTPDSHKIGLRINEPKANSTYYLGDPIKRLDVEVIDSRTNEIIKGFNEKEGYNYYWTIIDGAGYEETICVKRSTLSGGESFDIPKDLEAGPAKLRVLLYKGRSLIISEGINIILENKIKGGYIGVLRSSETEPPCEIYIDPSKKITIGKNEGNIHLVDGDFNDEIQAYIRYNGTVYLINKIGGSSTKMKIDDSDSSFHIFLKNATISIGNYNFLFELVNYNEEVHKIDLSNALLDKGVVLRLKNALKIKKIFPKEAYVEKGKNIILIDCDNLTKDSDATIGDQKLEGMEFLEQQIKGYIPPGKEGPADVRVWNEYGEDVVRGGFTYLPGEEKVGILKPLNCKPDEELYLDPYKYCEKFNPREDTSPYPLRIFYGLGVQDYILK
ncbi:hypothetical protein KY358_04740, partial [Candidatus Woesearchaeota archaeon]|nr:hypothetical protein [Candidatus Woesearchaeota archaeon]